MRIMSAAALAASVACVLRLLRVCVARVCCVYVLCVLRVCCVCVLSVVYAKKRSLEKERKRDH